jgi:hypothetical protein
MTQIRFRFWWLLILAIVVAVVVWRWRSSQVPETPSGPEGSQTPTAARLPSPSTSTQAPIQTGTSAASPVETSSEQAAALKKVFEAKKMRIDFWGRVVDAKDHPLAEANVRAVVNSVEVAANGELQDKSDRHNLSTDTKGEFRINGAIGSSLEIERITKADYILIAHNQRRFHYAGREVNAPDPSQPVVFKMVRQSEAANIVHHRFSVVPIPCDGTPAYFDLVKGTRGSVTGHLQVSLVRNPIEIDPKRPFNWKATFSVANGGLLRIEHEDADEAPTEGYKPSITFESKADSPDWSPTLPAKFFLRFDNGQCYGRIHVELSTNFQPPPTGMIMDSWVNCSGSRSLPIAARQ